jgi:glycine hydroxymethyltransferase
MNNVAGAAVTFKKAAEPEFRAYAEQTMTNAKVLAKALMDEGVSLITGGTDNHLMVMDVVKSFVIDGRIAQETLDKIGITANKQVIPDDPLPPVRPSGVRLGTPACTTRGMGEADMRRIAGWIVGALRKPEDEAGLTKMQGEAEELCRSYPVPGID